MRFLGPLLKCLELFTLPFSGSNFLFPMDLDRQSGASHISFPIWRPIPIVHNIGEYTVKKKPKWPQTSAIARDTEPWITVKSGLN